VQADLARVEHAIAAVKAGDLSALEYLYDRYADVVCAYVASIVGDRNDAQDITQGVFQKLPRAVEGYTAGGLPFEGWLLRVGRSSALDFLRGKSGMSPERLEVLLAFLDLAAAEHFDYTTPPPRLSPSVSLA
jgi:RNA polymerase sigma-70 factor, ECF subfamily